MTSSRASSSRRGTAAAVAALALAACGGHLRTAAPGRAAASGLGPGARVAFFPPVNLSGVPVPAARLAASIEVALRARGIELVGGDVLDWFLARHRVRYTAGIDGETARLAREELGISAVLFTSIDLYATVGVPRYGATMRLVTADDPPVIVWADGFFMDGDEAPGLLALGVVRDVAALERRGDEALAGSLAAFLEGRRVPASACEGGGRFEPRIRYRAPRPISGDRTVVAVLPFVNESHRRDAGDLASAALVRELAATDGLEVLEPGVVRAALLQYHVVMEGGVTHEAARIALGSLDADVVLGGYVRTYDETEPPTVELTLVALATYDNHVVWESTSYSRGNAPIQFFGLGREATANALLCRVARATVDRMADAWAAEPRPDRRRAAPKPRAAGGPQTSAQR